MQVILRAFVWDFAYDKMSSTFRRLREEWGLDGISFVVTNPAKLLLLPNSEQARFQYADEGAVCFCPERSWYADLNLMPISSKLCGMRNPLKEVTEKAKELGLRVSAVVSCCYNPSLGKEHPELTVQNALGDRILHLLCPANPTVREFLVRMVGDLVTNYPLDAVELEDLGYLNLTKLDSLTTDLLLPPAADFLLSRCFCEYCCQIAVERGIEIERVRFFVQTELEQFFIAPTELSLSPLEWDFWEGLVEGEARKVIHMRMDIVSSLLSLLVEQISHKHDKRAHVEGHLLPASLWQVGIDRQRLRELADVVEVDAKEVAPERLPPYLLLNRQVLGEQAELWVRLHPSERFIPNKQAFLAQVRACKEQKVDGVVIVGYGSLRKQNWDWIREAITLLKS
ncbi:MAG: family 10 glycosylhydrolase [Armatimonadetes bacterium]|nr:family 10 glycosylhydrolase [Armatimonadota bacterium]MDW8028405.1 hypothetical protein [Armatimonadota bacterium]